MKGVPFPMSRSRLLFLFVAAVAITAVSHAQLTGYPPQRQGTAPAQTGTITLSGIVVNSVTGEPVPRAIVQMNGMVSRVALTDAEGRFQFENLPETQAMLMAHKPGYFTEMELRQGMGRMKPTTITAGMGSITVKLYPAGVVTGRVTTADGEPVESAGVSLKVRMIQNGRRQLMNRNGASTDEDGYFRIGNLQPGTYYLYSNGYSRLITDSDEVYSPAYYPGVSDVSGASAIEVHAGSTTVADLTLRKEKAYRVSGVVTGLLPNQNAQVELLGPDGENLPEQSAVRGDGNTFELRRVPAGSYTLKVVSQQRMNPGAAGSSVVFTGSMGQGAPRMPQVYTGSIPLNVSGDLTNVSVSVQPAATIPVVVRTDFTNKQSDNEGTSGSLGNSRRYQQYVMLHLVRTDGQRGDNYSQMSGPAESMSLSIQNVEPGRYHVEFMPMGNNYVRSATYNNTDLLRDDLVVAGGDSQPIEVVVRDDAASLTGTARCEDSQCWVLIVPDGNAAIQPRQAFVNPQGSFEQAGLAPGSYRIYAFDRLDGIEYTNPEAMKAYGAHAETVVLTAGQKAQVNVDLTKVSDQ
jgi:Carboxypeptidase regulatory-like domain